MGHLASLGGVGGVGVMEDRPVSDTDTSAVPDAQEHREDGSQYAPGAEAGGSHMK